MHFRMGLTFHVRNEGNTMFDTMLIVVCLIGLLFSVVCLVDAIRHDRYIAREVLRSSFYSHVLNAPIPDSVIRWADARLIDSCVSRSRRAFLHNAKAEPLQLVR